MSPKLHIYTATMACPNNNSHWDAPKFSFIVVNQTEEWKTFHVRTLHYLGTQNDVDTPNQTKKGWKQIKMITGEDKQALQTLVENGIITSQIQETPKLHLNAIKTTIKAYKHFCHYCDELVSDLWQKPDEPIHSLNTHITQLINNCQFSNYNTKEAFKLIILQHAVKYHKARDWIHLQATLTYDELLSCCRTAETQCKAVPKSKTKRLHRTNYNHCSYSIYIINSSRYCKHTVKMQKMQI